MYFLWLLSRVSTLGSENLKALPTRTRTWNPFLNPRLIPCLTLRLPFFSVVYYSCVCFYLRFDFISFISLSFSLPLCQSACVSKFIFLFVSTVNLMCLWHVLTVSSCCRLGNCQFVLTFFILSPHMNMYGTVWVSV